MASRANLTINQGEDFSVVLNLTDENGDPLILMGFTAASTVRTWYTSREGTDFATVINTSAGSVELVLTAAQTASMHAGRMVYDVFIMNTSANLTMKIAEGIVTVNPAATQLSGLEYDEDEGEW
jgi:hypothetical protein